MFEREGSDNWNGVSPGGFEFGIQGFTYGPPVPKAITFFLDGSAFVADQYGRFIKGVQTPEGKVVLFADTPPEASREGRITPRPQFATHAQVVDALLAEGINWLTYEVRWRGRDNRTNVRSNLSMDEAVKQQTRLLQEGHHQTVVCRTVVCAGWPQLPYDQLKKMAEIPPTPVDDLKKILDPNLRKDALRFIREIREIKDREAQNTEEE